MYGMMSMQPQQQSWKGGKATTGGSTMGGKGGGAGGGFSVGQANNGGSAAQLPKLEETLSTKSWSMYESLLNLNVSQADVSRQWSEISALRAKILKIYNIPTKPAGAAAAAGAIANAPGVRAPGGRAKATLGGQVKTASDGPKEPYSWKNTLARLIVKRAGRSITKADLTYEVAAANEADPNSGYYCRVFTAMGDTTILSQPYATEEMSVNKKVAEQAVARVAVQYEFPEDFQECVRKENAAIAAGFGVAGMPGAAEVAAAARNRPARAALSNLAASVAPTKGTKRARAETVPHNAMDPSKVDCKRRVQHVTQLLLGRSVEKGDITWEYQESPGANVATVTIVGYDPTQYSSAPCVNKKEAESQAADQAIESLRALWEPLDEQRILKKAEMARVKKEKRTAADGQAPMM